MLHIISQAHIHSDSFFALLHQAQSPQTLLFYGDGCYNLQREVIQALSKTHTLLVLDDDLQARGIVSGHAQRITIDQLVQQVFAATHNTSWF